jgi:hypothetical protein
MAVFVHEEVKQVVSVFMDMIVGNDDTGNTIAHHHNHAKIKFGIDFMGFRRLGNDLVEAFVALIKPWFDVIFDDKL